MAMGVHMTVVFTQMSLNLGSYHHGNRFFFPPIIEIRGKAADAQLMLDLFLHIRLMEKNI